MGKGIQHRHIRRWFSTFSNFAPNWIPAGVYPALDAGPE